MSDDTIIHFNPWRDFNDARSLEELYLEPDRAQIEALSQLERALWGDGDAGAARAAVRGAFAKGPHWRARQATAKPLLPPLYPER